MDQTIDFAAFCKEKGVEIECEYGALENPHFKDSFPWTIFLKYQGRTIDTPFYQGKAYRKVVRWGQAYPGAEKIEYGKDCGKWYVPTKPTAESVIWSLISDAQSWEGSVSFDDFCSEFGYDNDSLRAQKIYFKCGETAKKIRWLLGNDYDEFVEACRDY